jgi:Domain of unknown function (DUF6916)
MTTSRRDFLKKGTVMALAAGVPVCIAKNAVADTIYPNTIDRVFTKRDFQTCLNTEFMIQNGGTKVKTTLVEISNLPGVTATSDKEGFSLMFKGGRTHALRQNTYSIEHSALGTFSLLLVPTRTAERTANYYVATINRLYP